MHNNRKQLKILLVQPVAVDDSLFYEIPLNIAYLAATLLAHDYDVSVADMQKGYPKTLEPYLDQNWDVVGIGTYSYTLNNSRDICKAIRRNNPSAIILLGGAHATFAAETTLKFIKDADFVICGESEMRLLQICNLISGGATTNELLLTVEGLLDRSFKQKKPIRPPDVISDIDSLETASDAFKLFGLEDSLKRNPFVPIIASRGCPHRCVYCASPAMWKRVRIRSWAGLKAELDQYMEMGIDHINFRDDDLSFLKNIHKGLLEYLKTNNIKWGCELRLDNIGHSEIRLFSESGLVKARVAIETIHDKSLIKLNKGWRSCNQKERINRVKCLVEECQDVRVSFMIGIPGETESDVRATFDFAERLKPAICAFWAYSPLPGTPIYLNPERHGIRKILPHDQLDPLYSIIETNELNNKTINALLEEARSRFTDNMWHLKANRSERIVNTGAINKT